MAPNFTRYFTRTIEGLIITIESLLVNCLVKTKEHLEQVSSSYAEPAFADYTAIHWVQYCSFRMMRGLSTFQEQSLLIVHMESLKNLRVSSQKPYNSALLLKITYIKHQNRSQEGQEHLDYAFSIDQELVGQLIDQLQR